MTGSLFDISDLEIRLHDSSSHLRFSNGYVFMQHFRSLDAFAFCSR